MTNLTDDDIVIRPVPMDRWPQALELVLSRRSTAERVRLMWWIFQGNAQTTLTGLLGAFEKERIVGATMVIAMPGRTAITYQPRVQPDIPETTTARLWQAMDAYLREQRVRLAQEVLPMDALADAATSQAAGFDLATELVYYCCDTSLAPAGFSSAPLTTTACEAVDRERLAPLIEATYEKTLDCQELNGVRSSVDVIDGYLEGGAWQSERWRFLQAEGQDVGCILLMQRSPDSCELIYLGLIPSARGRGWGRLATGAALRLAKELGCNELTVATDTRNTPARRVYEQAGFVEFDRRRVLLRVIDEKPADSFHKSSQAIGIK